MANNKHTYQQIRNVSINKEALLEIASNRILTKKDYKVLLCLFTELNGWSETPKSKDPLNFKKIDIKSIADTLDMSKKDVKLSIINLMDAEIIEDGENDVIKDGYRFTF